MDAFQIVANSFVFSFSKFRELPPLLGGAKTFRIITFGMGWVQVYDNLKCTPYYQNNNSLNEP